MRFHRSTDRIKFAAHELFNYGPTHDLLVAADATKNQMIQDTLKGKSIKGFYSGFLGETAVAAIEQRASDMNDNIMMEKGYEGLIAHNQQMISKLKAQGNPNYELIKRFGIYNEAVMEATAGAAVHGTKDFPISFMNMTQIILEQDERRCNTRSDEWVAGRYIVEECSDTAVMYSYDSRAHIKCYKPGDPLEYMRIDESAYHEFDMCNLQIGLAYGADIQKCATVEQLEAMAYELGRSMEEALIAFRFDAIRRNIKRDPEFGGVMDRNKIHKLLLKHACSGTCCNINSAIISDADFDFQNHLMPILNHLGQEVRINPANKIRNVYAEHYLEKFLGGDKIFFGERFLKGAVGDSRMLANDGVTILPMIDFRAPTSTDFPDLGDFDTGDFVLKAMAKVGYTKVPNVCVSRVEGCQICPTVMGECKDQGVTYDFSR